MPAYVCRNPECRERLSPPTGARRLLESKDRARKGTLVIICPKCKTRNVFEAPDK